VSEKTAQSEKDTPATGDEPAAEAPEAAPEAAKKGFSRTVSDAVARKAYSDEIGTKGDEAGWKMEGKEIEVTDPVKAIETARKLSVNANKPVAGKTGRSSNIAMNATQRELTAIARVTAEAHPEEAKKARDGYTVADEDSKAQAPATSGTPTANEPSRDDVMSVEDLKAIRMKKNLNEDYVNELADQLRKDGVGDNRVMVEGPEGNQFVGDGNHLIEAADRAGITELPVRIYANTPEGRAAANKAMAESEDAKASGASRVNPPKTEKPLLNGEEGYVPVDGRGMKTPKPVVSAEEALKAAGVTRTEPVALPGEKFAPTRQQQDIIDSVLQGKNTAVQALAGTGKTSTLEALALRLQQQFPDKTIAYIAFNKSVQREAEGRMPSNVESKTQHAVAYGWADKWMKDRSNDSTSLRRGDDVAGFLGIRNTVRDASGGEPMSAKEQAMAAVKTVDTFALSAEDVPDASHMPEKVRAMGPEAQAAVLDAANKIWADLNKPDGKMRYSLDHMRKQWALTKPDLSKTGSGLKRKADIIFMDEAQDTPKVMAHLMDQQTAQKVVVGDSNQNIYSSFTGSIDYMSQVQKDVELPLTKSWRFGPEVADIGNRFLELAEASTRVEGAGASSKIVSDMQEPDAILVRSNAGMLGEILSELEKGRTVGVPVGTKKDLQSLVASAAFLKGQGDAPPRMHDDLAAYRTWDEVVAEADAGNATMVKIANMVNTHGIGGLRSILNEIVEKGGDGLEGFVLRKTSDPNVSTADGKTFGNNNADYLKQAGFKFGAIPGAEPMKSGKNKGQPRKGWLARGTDDEQRAMFQKAKELASGEAVDVTISTAHKSKGLEWNKVKIGDDFKGPKFNEETGETDMPSPEELRLGYVAVTRAKGELDPGSLAYVFEHTQENGGIPKAPETKEPDNAKDDEQPVPTAPDDPEAPSDAPEDTAPAPESTPQEADPTDGSQPSDWENADPNNQPEEAPAPAPEDVPTAPENQPEEPAPSPEVAPAPAPEAEAPAPAEGVYAEKPMADYSDEEFAGLPDGTRFPRTRQGGYYEKTGPDSWKQVTKGLQDIGSTFTDKDVREAEGIERADNGSTEPATPETAPEAPQDVPEGATEAPDGTPVANEETVPEEDQQPEPEPEETVADPEVVPEPQELPQQDAPEPSAAPEPEETPAPAPEEAPKGGTAPPEPDSRPLHPVKAKAANYPDGTIIKDTRTGESIEKTNGEWHIAGYPDTPADPMDIASPYVYDMPKQADDSFSPFEGIDSVGPGDVLVTRKGTQVAVVGKRDGNLVVAPHNQTDEWRKSRPSLAVIPPETVKGVNKFDAAPAPKQGGAPATERKRTPFSSNRGNSNVTITDVGGNVIAVGDTVRTDMGTGKIVRVRPSDGPSGSAFVEFPDGTIKSFRSNKMRNTAAAEEVTGGDDPSKMEIGTMGEAGDGRAFMVGRGNKPIFKGDIVELADGTTGKISGFAKGVQSVNIRVEGRASDLRKKASVVDVPGYTAPDAAPQDTTPEAPESTPTPEAPAVPETDAEPEGDLEPADINDPKESPEDREQRIADATSNAKDPAFLSSWWDMVMKDDLEESDLYGLDPDFQAPMERLFGGEMERDKEGLKVAKAAGIVAWAASKDKSRSPEEQEKMRDLQVRITQFVQVQQARAEQDAKAAARKSQSGIVRKPDMDTYDENQSLKSDRALKPTPPLTGEALDSYSGVSKDAFQGDLFGDDSKLNVLSKEGRKLGETYTTKNSNGDEFRQGVKVYSKVGRYLGTVYQMRRSIGGKVMATVRIGQDAPGDGTRVYDIESLKSDGGSPPVWKRDTDLSFSSNEGADVVASRMEQAYPGVHFDFGRIRVERAREYAETMSKLFNKYPQLSASIVSVDTRVAPKRIGGATAYASTLNHEGLRSTAIVFNRAFSDNVKGTMRRGNDIKYFNNVPEGKEMEYVMTHEIGHALDYLTGNITDAEVYELMKELLPADVLARPERLGEYLFDKGMVSKYSTDPKTFGGSLYTVELVAESFADVELNGVNAKPISKLVHAELMRRLDEMSGGQGVIPQTADLAAQAV
jgi:hypothetical protein